MSAAWRLQPQEREATAGWIASVQLPSGMITWFPGGHADPWNHTEAAMALAVNGYVREAERAYEWLASSQLDDGSWCLYYLAEGVEEPRRDHNVCAYPAAGLWWHYLEIGDLGLLEAMWPVVERAIEFVLRLQRASGQIVWSRDVDGHAGTFALLTGNASMHHSLRCAVAIAESLGHERPDWELAAGRIAEVVGRRPEVFEPKHRWAMDWYYPVLGGVLAGDTARERIEERWDEFIMDGVGVRCVSDHPWVTAAETAECVMALDAAGLGDRAKT
ncbi:MAG: prenyltransferase, partial [Acidimicrobiales bacterium]